MGLLNQIWWVMGGLMAAPLIFPGVGKLLEGSYIMGAVFVALGIVALFLPEYLRWRLLGGSSVFERVPILGSRADGPY